MFMSLTTKSLVDVDATADARTTFDELLLNPNVVPPGNDMGFEVVSRGMDTTPFEE
jgi:hypothetical protein